MEEPVAVLACSSRHDAELTKSFLNAYGLDVFFRGDDFGGQHPPLTFVHEVVLEVRSSDQNKADVLLDSIERDCPEATRDTREIDELRKELRKAVRAVVVGLFIWMLQPFALVRAVQVLRMIHRCPEATRVMRNQIRTVVAMSGFANVVIVFQIAMMIANEYWL